LAVNVTACPKADAFNDEVIVVFVLARLTVSSKGVEVLFAEFESPL
jgi:hypothetical protein